MRYIEEFRNADYAQTLAKEIADKAFPSRHYNLMEFCGGHTHTIHRYDIPSLLPNNIEMIHGPGCPVCVLPIGRVDKAIWLASQPNVILCSYGDMLRVPGSGQKSLLQAKADGADVRMIYSVDDALKIAQQNPEKEVIFFAIGFETTTPPTAFAILQARHLNLSNFTVFCNHVLTPVAMECLLQAQREEDAAVNLDGFVGPAHVSIVIGSQAYEAVCQKYQKPIVISGFEPLDVLHSILMLVEQINQNRCEVEIQYTRAVTSTGNLTTQAMMDEVLQLRSSFEWRGLGHIPQSALEIKSAFAFFDAEKRFQPPESHGTEHKQCDCGDILRGVKKPRDCKLFAKICTPENPLGSCMVSSEGACAAVYAYGRGDVV
ncbi:hydrogenase formation protein HypD [Legionella israelensis]|uniref:Hydrogenase maturation factor n=2 Tax=Legionella israelensis TaxID=454 RepID=A0A0W0V1Y1_9GAMM|nr:hydrogenase formation protein HypD [Legionella israelensis]KTD14111.1 hydrogenase expression/formation protein HypD [Legionella israelensis]QBS10324.1 hydrogenase formation protein HypD [Legionella israelensis]SCY34600.1 Hydrogenase maturation protein HypD [Legionella israelensis DSM 19235]STX59925.1 hydrogenase expression/formation protein HypD [Legionella israelensis]